jgi:hypothetical protein
MKDRELALELGLAGMLLLVLLGAAVLAVSWVAGGVERGQRHAAGPPDAGRVPEERHQHISSAAPR